MGAKTEIAMVVVAFFFAVGAAFIVGSYWPDGIGIALFAAATAVLSLIWWLQIRARPYDKPASREELGTIKE